MHPPASSPSAPPRSPLAQAHAATVHSPTQQRTASDASAWLRLSSLGGRPSSQSSMWSFNAPGQPGLVHLRPVSLNPTCNGEEWDKGRQGRKRRRWRICVWAWHV